MKEQQLERLSIGILGVTLVGVAVYLYLLHYQIEILFANYFAATGVGIFN